MSLIRVKVIPKSSQNKIIDDESQIVCYVSKPASRNEANKEVIKLLSKLWNVPKSCIVIRRGVKSRIKYIEKIC